MRISILGLMATLLVMCPYSISFAATNSAPVVPPVTIVDSSGSVDVTNNVTGKNLDGATTKSSVHDNADGTTTTTEKTTYADGTSETQVTVTVKNPNGSTSQTTTITLPNGQTEIVKKSVSYPTQTTQTVSTSVTLNGNVTETITSNAVKNADGSTTTTSTDSFSNGQVNQTVSTVTPTPSGWITLVTTINAKGEQQVEKITVTKSGTTVTQVVTGTTFSGKPINVTTVTDTTSSQTLIPVNGVCGTANGTMVSSAPNGALCSSGSASSISGSGPWSWSCTGINGGTNASCSAVAPKICIDASGNSHASGSSYSLQLSQTQGSSSASVSQCPYGGVQPIITTVTQTYSCTNGTQTALGASVSAVALNGNPLCNAPASCGSTPSGSTVTQQVSQTSGSTTASAAQCPYGGTQATTTITNQTYLCTNGTLSPQGSPSITTVTSGGPSCNAPPVAGTCGPMNGQVIAAAPTTGLCATGTASTIVGSGPWTWSCAGINNGSTSSCSASNGSAYTLANLAPALVSSEGFDNPSYDKYVAAQSPVTAVSGDVSEQFTAPNSTNVVVTVKSPVTTKTYTAPPIAAGEDPYAYFVAQLHAAGSGATLIIPKGEYNFLSTGCSNNNFEANILILGLHDMVIDGQGSTLNFVAECSAFQIYQSQRITIQNFVISWPNQHYAAVGYVSAVDTTNHTFSVEMPAANAVQNFTTVHPWDTTNNYWSLTDHNEIFFPTQQNFTSTTDVNGVQYAIASNLPLNGNNYSVGMPLLVRSQAAPGANVDIYQSSDITINNVDMYGGPGFAFFYAQGRGLHINNCHLDRAPNGPISTASDADHSGSWGGDIIVENSSFAYQGDDGTNIHTYMSPQAAVSCSSSTNCPVTLPSSFMNQSGVQNGETIGLFDPTTKFIGVTTASCTSGSNCSANIAPIAATGGYLADLAETPARFIFRNNTFYHNRARGALIQSPYGLVENNTFVGQTLFSLYLLSTPSWSEGPGAQDVLIVNNSFSSPGVNGGPGAITTGSENNNGLIYNASQTSSNGFPPLPGTIQNLIFANNTFSNLPGAAMYISSSNNVILYNNNLVSTNLDTEYFPQNVNAPIVVYDASNAFLSGNISHTSANANSMLLFNSSVSFLTAL